MLMRGLVVSAILAGLAGCGFLSEATPAEAAERNISDDLDALFPGIDTVPATRCVQSQATAQEFSVLAQSDVNTTAVTRNIFEREATLACLQANDVIEVFEVEA